MAERASMIDIHEVYEALDTVREDEQMLGVEYGALRDDVNENFVVEPGDSEAFYDRKDELDTLDAMEAADRGHLLARYRYAVSSLFGRVSLRQLGSAAEQYALNADEEDRTEVSRRAATYNLAIDYSNYQSEHEALDRGFAIALAEHVEPVEPVAVDNEKRYRAVKYERDTEDPEKVWISLSDRRSLALVGADSGNTQPEVVSSYPVDSFEVDDDGQTVVRSGVRSALYIAPDGKKTWREMPDSGQRFTFGPDSDTYRMVEDDRGRRVELFVPPGRRSVDSLPSRYDDDLDRMRTTQRGQMILQLAGAHLPNVISTFEHPDGVNPRPIAVPKTQ